jgi:hypothetical protein
MRVVGNNTPREACSFIHSVNSILLWNDTHIAAATCRLSGKLPSLSNWLQLQYLSLQHNRFDGEVSS